MIVTPKEAVNLMSNMLNNEIDLQGEDLEKVIFAVNEHLQVRDWLMGLPMFWSNEESMKFLEYMAVHSTPQDSIPFTTVMAMIYYENGEKEKCHHLLNYSLHLDSQYSLAQLLKRVMDAGFPEESFKTMRQEIHPKVVAAIEEEAEQPIKKGAHAWQFTE